MRGDNGTPSPPLKGKAGAAKSTGRGRPPFPMICANLTTYVPQWNAAVWGCCYWEASCAEAWGSFSEKSLERASEKSISSPSWTSRAATGFPARISQDPRSARGLNTADYPLQVRLRCPGLPSAEPFSPVNFGQLATIQGNVFPWPLSSDCRAQSPEKCSEKQLDPAAVSSFGCLPQCLGGDEAGCRPGSALLSGSLLNVTPPLRIPCQR